MKLKFTMLLIVSCTIFSLSAQTVSTIASEIDIDDDLIVAPDGSIIGSKYTGAALRKLTLDGEVSVFANGFSAPNGLAYDSQGNLFMADNTGNMIYKIQPDGSYEEFAEISSPSGLIKEWDSDTLIATTYTVNGLVKVAPDGAIVPFANDPLLNGPVGLCYDDDNNLYVGNFNNRKILSVTEHGEVSSFADINTSGYLGFIAYRDGYIYGTLFQQAEIWRIDSEGNDELWLGSVSGSADGGPEEATFNRPNGIRFSPTRDTLFISDFGTRSVRMITDIDGVSADNESLKIALNATMDISPNPATTYISVSLNLPKASRASLWITNMDGRRMTTLFKHSYLSSGKHGLEYSLPEMPAGQYYLILRLEGEQQANMASPFIIK